MDLFKKAQRYKDTKLKSSPYKGEAGGVISLLRGVGVFAALIILITSSHSYAAEIPNKKIKKSEKKVDINLSIELFYRNSDKKLKLSSVSKDSDLMLTISRWQLSWKEKVNLFVDIGAGIFKINDPVLFSSLSVPVNLQTYDGGRGFAYGGGISGRIFEKSNFALNAGINVTRLTNSSENTSLKVLNSKADASWLEYNGDISLEYGGFKYVKPYIGASYSNVDVKLKIEQTIQSSKNNQTKTLDEKNAIGAFFGFNILPLKDIFINLQGRLISETGVLASLRWNFREL